MEEELVKKECTLFLLSPTLLYSRVNVSIMFELILYTENFHYIDPGTTSYIFQAILAAGITVGVFFRNIKFGLISIISKFKKKSE